MPLAAHASVIYLKAAAVGWGAGDEVDGITKAGVKINGEQLDTTDFKDTSAWHTFIQGLKNGTIEFSFMVEPSDAPQSLLRSSLLAYADLWTQVLRNPTGGANLKGFQSQVMVESYSEDVDVAGLVVGSASLRMTGAVTLV
jgi:hypothetical protein